MLKTVIAMTVLLALTCAAQADVVTKTVEYEHDGVVLEGFMAWDDQLPPGRPAVVVVHEWWGLNEYAKSRAVQLAEMGLVAFAADIYGKGNRAANRQEAGKFASVYKKDRKLMRGRAAAAVKRVIENKHTDPARVTCIGYCFGGTVALELARSGANIAGVVSFHGGLDTPDPADAKKIKAKVLVCHGAADPHVGPDEVTAFQKEMADAKVDWQMIYYAGAVHAFTNPASGDDASRGAAYNKAADRRSWQAMMLFFRELFIPADDGHT